MKGKVEVFLELEEVADIEERAKEAGISRSAWIREAVQMRLIIEQTLGYSVAPEKVLAITEWYKAKTYEVINAIK